MKFLKYALILAAVTSTTSVFADNQTVSLGYAQTTASGNDSDVSDKFKGINLQYRYETETPWGVIVSSSYITGKDTLHHDGGEENFNVKYFSLLAGPSYRFNDYVSLYALAGFANVKDKYNEFAYDGSYSYDSSVKSTQFAYGAGVAINPVQNVAINIGYEGTTLKEYDENVKLNGFNIGVGYRF